MMNIINKKYFITLIIGLFLIAFFQASSIQAVEFDLTAAQNAVGKRFASKFCEAKKKGFSLESSSEFALNNTYLKFVTFPDHENFIEDLWGFTIETIQIDCGNYVTKDEEINLRDFFEEEGKIATNRDSYLPH